MGEHYLKQELYRRMREKPEIFEFLQAGSLDGIWYWDLERVEHEWMSPRFWEVLGYDPSEKRHLAGEWRNLIHPDDLKVAAENLEKHCADPNHPYDQVVRYCHKDGSTVWVRCRGLAIRDDSGKAIRMLGAHSDFTEQMRAQEQLRQTQKMEAVGRLAGGVAHGFNNLLTVILGYCEIALRQLPADDPLHSQLTMIHDAGEQAASLTRQLLAFSRRQVLRPQALNLNQVVERLDRMLRLLIGEDIELAMKLNPEIGLVRFDPGQLEQIIFILALNARDAMPDGGRLIIETDLLELNKSQALAQASPRTGPQVSLAISDNGTGMDARTRALVFEPFFTTKEAGEGTGLGLSVVHGIVNQAGGGIRVFSEPAKGSTFQVILPLAEEGAAPPEPALGAVGTEQGSGTVLVVEDEPAVRSVITDALKTAGYSVLSARVGQEALDLCSRHDGDIHLLVTDVVMPQMDGYQLAKALLALRPQLRILYVSGHLDRPIGQEAAKLGASFLEKPIMAGKLLEAVRDVLSAQEV